MTIEPAMTPSDEAAARIEATIHHINSHWWNARRRPEAPDLRLLLDERTTAQAEIAALRAEVARKDEALGLALGMLVEYEPGDSRLVSDEFVAMAAIHAGIIDRQDECLAIIRKATAALLPEPVPPPTAEQTAALIAALAPKRVREGDEQQEDGS